MCNLQVDSVAQESDGEDRKKDNGIETGAAAGREGGREGGMDVNRVRAEDDKHLKPHTHTPTEKQVCKGCHCVTMSP